ncbi:MAG: hypothetical protein AAFP89_15860 [Bacteroidota bacterium]
MKKVLPSSLCSLLLFTLATCFLTPYTHAQYSKGTYEGLGTDEAYIINKVNQNILIEVSQDKVTWGRHTLGTQKDTRQVHYNNLSNQDALRRRYGYLRVHTPGTNEYITYIVYGQKRYKLTVVGGKVVLKELAL